MNRLKYNEIESEVTKMTTLKVTEYVPAYNYMEEIHVEYDFTNHRYKVDTGNWKQMTTEYELRIKEQYKVN